MKALVTGSAGFIGHHLVRRLVREGAHVVVLDDLSGGERARVDLFGDRVAFLRGSILDETALDAAVAGCPASQRDRPASASIPR